MANINANMASAALRYDTQRSTELVHLDEAMSSITFVFRLYYYLVD